MNKIVCFLNGKIKMDEICSAMLEMGFENVCFSFCNELENGIKSHSIYVKYENEWSILYSTHNPFKVLKGNIQGEICEDKFDIDYTYSNIFSFSIDDIHNEKEEEFYDELIDYLSNEPTTLILDYDMKNLMFVDNLLEYFQGIYYIDGEDIDKKLVKVKQIYLGVDDVDIIKKDNKNFCYLKK